MATYTRPILLLLCGLLLLTLVTAVLNTLVPLWLAHENLPTWQVGIVSSSYFTGNLVGAMVTGGIIKRFGFNRSYYLATILFALGCGSLGLVVDAWSWTLCRFIGGVGCAMIWVVVESALMCSGTNHNRGRLLAAYMMVTYIGTVLGQFAVSQLPTALVSVLPWATGIVLAAILPLLFTKIVNNNQTHAQQDNASVSMMLRLRDARLGVHGCIISGIVLGSLYALMPLYLNHQGLRDSEIGFWMAVMISAGVVGQWPIGRLADKYGRLFILRGQVFAIIVGSIGMFSHAAMAPALCILGAAGFTLYPVAMAWACEKVTHHQVVAMNQALLLSYTIGSLLGPLLTAALMESYSDSLLFIVIAAVSLVYLMLLLRETGQHSTPVAHA
ncbi:MFS transporter [Citrobacter sp. JGM124]|uniref:MFS transporter n=1 Tax=Citrobacter sp. JGM124 TaxID=2799789 RepID=UPI001BAA46FF|nr:MFS transporter [Citrobacter sp. JGM124]MBS0847792.1 MFS transporter [Citrobacter sp. JGM124]